MTKHTPGPWQFNGPEIYAPNFRGVRKHHYDVARVLHVMDDEGEANARLIAAAPDMLQMLRDVDAHFAAHFGEQAWATSEIGGMTRVTIAKAEGGAA